MKKRKVYLVKLFSIRNLQKTSGNLKQLFNGIINNLKVVDEFIQPFNEYIKQIKSQNNDKNLHSDNFEININYKKDIITIEYNKYCDKFMKTIEYFMECSLVS